MSDVGSDIVRLAEIKQALTLLSEEKDLIEQQIIAGMGGAKTTKVSTPWDGTITATVVRGERVIISEESLKKKIGATLWGKVTKQVLDKEKLEAHVATGAISATDVAACSETKENKPYVKVSGDTTNPAMKAAVEDFAAKTGNPHVTVKNSKGAAKPAAKRVRKPSK